MYRGSKEQALEKELSKLRKKNRKGIRLTWSLRSAIYVILITFVLGLSAKIPGYLIGTGTTLGIALGAVFSLIVLGMCMYISRQLLAGLSNFQEEDDYTFTDKVFGTPPKRGTRVKPDLVEYEVEHWFSEDDKDVQSK